MKLKEHNSQQLTKHVIHLCKGNCPRCYKNVSTDVMPNKSSLSLSALWKTDSCKHSVDVPLQLLLFRQVLLHNASACLSLFATYINALSLYFMPPDSNICTPTAVWKRSNGSQTAVKCPTVTDWKFHTTRLYLCTMIHTVADYFLEMFCLFPKRHWKALLSPPLILHPESSVFPACKQLCATKRVTFIYTQWTIN